MPDDLTPPGKAEESAENARIVLENYARLIGAENEPVETNMVDLIGDLLHLAAAEELDIDHVLDTARMHFDAESEA